MAAGELGFSGSLCATTPKYAEKTAKNISIDKMNARHYNNLVWR
jgi:hypothetical protein